MAKLLNIKEMKSLFKKKLKDRQKIKGISFSHGNKKYPKRVQIRKPDISLKQKITDRAIIDSFRNYSAFKSFIYAKEQQEKNIIKKEKMENENIKDLKNHLNYSNILQLFNLVFNKYNPFDYNIKMKKSELDKAGRTIYKNKVKQMLLKKILHEKKITSRIDSGIKRDNINNIYKKIEESKKNYEKIKLFSENKLGLSSYTTRENNKSYINRFKKLNKSNSCYSCIINKTNKTNLMNYNNNVYELNNSCKTNEKKKNESVSYESTGNNNIIKLNNENKETRLHKCKSETQIYNFNININNSNLKKEKNKSEIVKLKKSKKVKLKSNKKLYMVENSKIKNKTLINNNSPIIGISKNKIINSNINYKKPKFKIINQKILEEEHKNYASNIEDMYREYNKIKSNTNKLKLDYKFWHFSKFRDIDEIVDIKEDMLLSLLKQKYFRNQNYCPKKTKINKKNKNSVIEIIRENFNRIEDDDFKFGKKLY